MVAIGISETANLLAQVIFQDTPALRNFISRCHRGKSIELRVGMAMGATLYTTCADLDQLLPGKHRACRFPLVPQPATCLTDKRGSNVKGGCKSVLLKYRQGGGKKIGETIIKRQNDRSFWEDKRISRSCLYQLCDGYRRILMIV